MSNRSRGWFLTNNYKESEPIENKELLNLITNISGIVYTAFQLEQGKEGTKHHQIYIYFKHAKTFEVIKKLFPNAHIEIAKGTPQEASEYCTKADTRIGEPTIWGELPIQGKRSDIEDMVLMIEEGHSLKEVRQTYPSQYLRYGNKFKELRQDILQENYGNIYRPLNVIYLYGEPGIGKTRYIAEKYGYENIYVVTDYEHPFDSYDGEPVIVFEEFRNSLSIAQMLHYLDGQPIKLPARYTNRVACYIKVYIVSNWKFEDQYTWIKNQDIQTYKAFRRRIHFIGNLDEVIAYDKIQEITQNKNLTESAVALFGDKVTIQEHEIKGGENNDNE